MKCPNCDMEYLVCIPTQYRYSCLNCGYAESAERKEFRKHSRIVDYKGCTITAIHYDEFKSFEYDPSKRYKSDVMENDLASIIDMLKRII